MKFVFSKHSLEQMQLRNIRKSIVEEILGNPDHVIKEDGKKVYHSVKVSGGKRYLFRIFVSINKTPNIVITVYRTSKIEKYYEGKI